MQERLTSDQVIFSQNFTHRPHFLSSPNVIPDQQRHMLSGPGGCRPLGKWRTTVSPPEDGRPGGMLPSCVVHW